MLINNDFNTGFDLSGNGDAVWNKVSGGVSVAAGATATVRKKWFKAEPGVTYTFSCEMGGGFQRARMILYTTENGSQSISKQTVRSDSLDIKTYSISYTAPIGAVDWMIGIGFYTNVEDAVFLNPRVSIDTPMSADIVGCAYINMDTPSVDSSISNYGINNVIDNGDNGVQVRFDFHGWEDGINDNIALNISVTDATPVGTATGFIRVTPVKIVGKRPRVVVYFVDSLGSVMPAPPGSKVSIIAVTC